MAAPPYCAQLGRPATGARVAGAAVADTVGAAGAEAGEGAGATPSGVFGYLSILRHYEALLRGVFNSADLLYYLLFIVTFIVLSIRRLDSYRLQH